MALGTGQLSLGDIAGEYGGSAPHALSEYYDKGNAPGSGEIQIHADFQGTSNTFPFTISSNTTNANLRTLAVAAGWDETLEVIATINAGVTISATNTSNRALTIDGSWAGGVTLINNGEVLGHGGNGSTGGQNNASAGGAGSDALYTTVAVTVDNNGSLSGGGGGGGGGAGYANCHGSNIQGAGGGGGAPGGSGASSNAPGGGASGSNASGSSGGAGGTNGHPWFMVGGAGGGYGQAGGAGAQSAVCGCGCGSNGAGGAAGYAARGNSYITWDSTGTRNGTVG